MWEWLGTQAQTASPFVAVFCLLMLGLAANVIVVLDRRNQKLQDGQALRSEAVAVALNSIDQTNKMTLGIVQDLTNGNRRRR